MTTFKATSRAIKSPLFKTIGSTMKNTYFKKIGNSIKNSVGMLRRNKNTVKTIACDIKEKYSGKL